MSDNGVVSALDRIANVIKDTADRTLFRAFNQAREESNALGMFHWHGVTRTGD